jgi:Uma2 family endonuclease
VVEILSLGYEEKDLGDDGAPFYLQCGVLDVLVVDPRSHLVRHYRPDQPMVEKQGPIAVDLACGCSVRL